MSWSHVDDVRTAFIGTTIQEKKIAKGQKIDTWKRVATIFKVTLSSCKNSLSIHDNPN